MLTFKFDGSIFPMSDFAPTPVPLFEIAIFGDGPQLEAVRHHVRELAHALDEAWGRISTVEKSAESEPDGQHAMGDKGWEPDVLFVILTDNKPDHFGQAKAALSSSKVRRRFLLAGGDADVGPYVDLKACSDAQFVIQDPDLLLHPLVVLTSPPGIIGVDFADFISVWSGRWSQVCRLSLSMLTHELHARLPFEGLVLTFSGLGLLELDSVIDRVKTVIPHDVDLVWHDDSALRSAPSDTVDVCFAYDVEDAICRTSIV